LFRVQVETAAVRASIRRLLTRRDANCIDVGAHIGSMLSLIMELAPEGQHMAFEPMPEKTEWLRKKFPEVEVYAKALGAEPGHASFSINQTRSGFSGLKAHGVGADRFTEIEVEIARLDDLVPEDREIELLKVVVEGAELSVLQGAERILRQSRPSMIVESSASALQAWGIEPRSVYDFLADHQYELRTPQAFLRGGPALSFEAYESAQKYPFAAFRFVATQR
jgi:FkbM family methyltransferase